MKHSSNCPPKREPPIFAVSVLVFSPHESRRVHVHMHVHADDMHMHMLHMSHAHVHVHVGKYITPLKKQKNMR